MQVIDKVRNLLIHGRYNEAVGLLVTYSPGTYRVLVARIINMLRTYPGYLVSSNGRVYTTRDLIQMLQQGRWNRVLAQLLLSEIELMRMKMGR